jgi:hypothetical protein
VWSGKGRPPRFATNACRAAAYRRRAAGLPEDLPRQENDHGRRPLAAIVARGGEASGMPAPRGRLQLADQGRER